MGSSPITQTVYLNKLSPMLLLQVDTTDIGYKIGYEIGSWLPFIIIVVLALLVWRRAYGVQNKD